MAATSPADLLAQLQAFNANSTVDPSTVDGATRQKLHKEAEKLARAFAEPSTLLADFGIGQPAKNAIYRIALDLGIFPLLAKDKGPHTVATLSQRAGGDPRLFTRVIRALEAYGVVSCFAGGVYELAPAYQPLESADFAETVALCTDLIQQIFRELPGIVRDNSLQEPTDRLNGALQRAMNASGQDPFDVFKSLDTKFIKAFSTYLQAMSKDSAKPYEVYPVQERLVEGFEDGPTSYLWVDIGGGFGQFTADLTHAFSNLPGKLAVEDLAPVIALAKEANNDNAIEFITHDFFTEQPIKGARAYYMRECFHNWQDENCKTILKRLAAAMKPGYSKILIHEVVMPVSGASLWQVNMDWTMMASYSTLERSEQQWKDLIESAGLKINKIFSKPTSAESIIEIVL